jgi:hypothetical protein
MMLEKGFCPLDKAMRTGADMLFYQLDRAFYPHGPVIPEFRKNRQINELLRFFVRASAWRLRAGVPAAHSLYVFARGRAGWR